MSTKYLFSVKIAHGQQTRMLAKRKSEESVMLKNGSKDVGLKQTRSKDGQKIGSSDHTGQRSVSVNLTTSTGFRAGDVILQAI